jgi:hypothetical protein
MRTAAHRRCSFARRGLSILEFLGCLSALAGGLVLGSMYLGVDVKEMAYCVLEQAQVVEPRPKPTKRAPAAAGTELESASSASPILETAADGSPSSTTTGDAVSAPTDGQSAPAETETTPPPAAPPAEPATGLRKPIAGLFAREDLITDEQRRALTTAYWEALGACMRDEVKRRVPAIDAEGNWQLFDYLTGRKDGHLKASGAIAALDQRGVDDHVLAYAKKARSWHEDGARLFGRAVDLLTDAPTAQLSGPFAQSWQSAATQHRMEERLLAEKEQAVREYLAHAYETATSPDAVAEGEAASNASAAGGIEAF